MGGFFACEICLCVVEDPLECSTCNQLMCNGCITNWLSQNKTCPNCRAAWVPTKSLNRFVKQQLDAFEFKCDKCQVVFKYEQRKAHWESCGVIFKCEIPGCGNCGPFDSGYALLQHWEDDCLVIPMKCTECEHVLTRAEISQHDCSTYMAALVKKLRDENTALKEANKKLTE